MARRVSNSGQTRIKRNLEAIMPLTRQIFSLLKYYVIGVAIVLLIANFIAKPVVVRGSSMNPTLNNFDICISNRLSIVLGGTIDRFDIVVAQTEEGEIVKRVVGIPGDTVAMRNGVLYVNGEAVEESYIDYPANYEMAETVVEEGHYFVLGDNRASSKDSHVSTVGQIPREDIKGHVRLVIYPFNAIRTIQ